MRRSRNDKPEARIPVNRDGYVPVGYLREFNGTRSARSQAMDARRTARRVFPSRVTPDQARTWMSAPHLTDIEGIDAPQGKANIEKVKTQKRRRAPRKRKGTEYSQAFWDSLPWDTDPETALRMATEAQAVEEMGFHEDMRALLEDDAYGEISNDGRWRYDDRAAAEAFYRKKRDEVFLYGNYNRKAFEWEALAGGVYTIHDGQGNYIDVTRLPAEGPGWFVSANHWGVPKMKFRTREEAMRFAESLMGAR